MKFHYFPFQEGTVVKVAFSPDDNVLAYGTRYLDIYNLSDNEVSCMHCLFNNSTILPYST